MQKLPKIIYRFFLLFYLPLISFGQNTIGLPNISNFSKEKYLGGTQNWDIKQDKNGIVYFANNEGLLTFDGNFWSLFPLPNKTVARSIGIGKDNNIYVGGQDEIGYFKPGKNGKLEFNSLISLIPDRERKFGDVWDIIYLKNEIFFRTSNKIFKLSNNIVTTFQAPSEWNFLSSSGEELLAQDNKLGLMIFKNNTWAPYFLNTNARLSNQITSIIHVNSNTSIITTLKNGIFKLVNNNLLPISSPLLEKIKAQRIYSAIALKSGFIALATTLGGIYIVSLNGELIQHFSKKEGLQNNNVLSIFSDFSDNIWLGLDNGIDYIGYNSAIKQIFPDEQNASGYAAIINNNKLYIGTSSGLFQTTLQNEKDLSFSKGSFTLVENTIGQVWNLSEINGKLLMGHHEGAFEIINNRAILINNDFGYWNFLPVSNVFPSQKIVAGNYNGIQLFKFLDNKFSELYKIPDFIESSRYVTIDRDDIIWVSHPYHGVYRLKDVFNSKCQVKLYTKNNGLPYNLNNHVFKIKNQVVVATEKGIYYYNQEKDKFEPSEYYKNIIGELSIRYLKEDNEGNIWFVHEKTMGVIDYSNNKPKVTYIPELNNKMVSGFEFVMPINEKNIFLGGEKGFYHINFEKYKQNSKSINIFIRNVKIENQKDSTLFGGYFNAINDSQFQSKITIPSINFKWNNVHFEFASPLTDQSNTTLYSYKLIGLDENWSDWNNKNEKYYTNLAPGSYTFQIKAKNSLGLESEIANYSFDISFPWYRSPIAYFLYLIFILFGLYKFYFTQKKKLLAQQTKYQEEQKKLQYLHQLEIDKTEAELITLRNQKLQSEIDFKNSELATNAMHLVQKGELLSKLKTELNQVIKSIDNEKSISELKKMIKVVNEDEKIDNDWEHFAQHFDKVHSGFVSDLKIKHADLSANELKLCTFLRMNLSSKEIAQLLNITVRGVEISRYRLRKKLKLTKEVNLFDYLINLKK